MRRLRKSPRRAKPLFCHALAEGDRIRLVLDGLDAMKIRAGLPGWPSDGARLIRVRVEDLGEEEGDPAREQGGSGG